MRHPYNHSPVYRLTVMDVSSVDTYCFFIAFYNGPPLCSFDNFSLPKFILFQSLSCPKYRSIFVTNSIEPIASAVSISPVKNQDIITVSKVPIILQLIAFMILLKGLSDVMSDLYFLAELILFINIS